MKIYSRFISLVIALLIMQPSYGQSNIHNVYDSYKKKLTDFKDCLFGTKVCSPKEKAVKYTAVTLAALVLLSTALYVGQRIPGVIKEGSTVPALQEKIKNLQEIYNKILPSAIEYQKRLPELRLEDSVTKFMAIDNNTWQDFKQDLEQVQQMGYVDLKARKKALSKIRFAINEIERTIKDVQKILSQQEK